MCITLQWTTEMLNYNHMGTNNNYNGYNHSYKWGANQKY